MVIILIIHTGEKGKMAKESWQWRLSHKYATALKTKSFDEFSGRLRTAICRSSSSSSSLFTDFLLPDEEHVNTVIHQHMNRFSEQHRLTSCYFTNTQNAFELCVLLLESTHKATMCYRGIQNVLDRLQETEDLSKEQCNRITAEFISFVGKENPFLQVAHFKSICESFEHLHQQLQLRRQNLGKKLKFFCCAEKLFPQLGKQGAQMDAAAKGCYVLKNDLETTRMLTVRLYDEVEDDQNIVRMCQGREYEIYCVQQVVRVLKRTEENLRQRLDEIGVQACLCLHNINRTRTLLLHQIHQ